MNEFFCARYAIEPVFAPPDTKPKYLPDTTFRTEHIRLDLEVDFKNRSLDGSCTTEVRLVNHDTRTLIFDAAQMEICGVRLGGGTDLSYEYDGKKLTVTLPKPKPAGTKLTVTIDYRVSHPRAGIRFIMPDKAYPNRPTQVWTQGQTDDSRCWFPCRDLPGEKATTEMVVTVPEEFRAISNGVLVSEKSDPERKKSTFHWKMSQPHSLYLVTLTVGRFAEIREEWNKIPILYYCEKNRVADAKRGFEKTPKAMEFFSKEIGILYPYEKYAQIAAAEFRGGMENTTATTQTDLALIDARAALAMDFDGLVAHELAHQWFGDFVTCKDWSHGWLNESFATYYELLFQEHDKGRQEFLYRLWKYASNYLAESGENYQRPVVTQKWRESFHLFDRHLYEKGACILHLFRTLLGDENWQRAIKHYLENHRNQCVETRDLIEAIRQTTGRNLEPYFDQWIFRAGHPELHVHYSWNEEAKEARLLIVQKQAVEDGSKAFDLPLDIRFQTSSGSHSFREQLHGREQAFVYPLHSAPRLVLIDPESTIPIKRVTFIKPAVLWRNQLSEDPNPAGRIAAAEAIGEWNTPEAAKTLAAAFRREKFWGVQAELVRILGRMRIPAAFDALKPLARAGDARVRRTVVEALGEYGHVQTAGLFEALFRKDRSTHVQAEAVRSLAKTSAPVAKKVLSEALKMDSWCELFRIAAVDAIARREGKIGSLRPYLKYGQPTPVRLAAVHHIGRIGRGEPEAARLLLDLVRDPSEAVPVAAVAALGKLGDPSAIPDLKKLLDENISSRIRAIADRAIRLIRLGQSEDPPEPKIPPKAKNTGKKTNHQASSRKVLARR